MFRFLAVLLVTASMLNPVSSEAVSDVGHAVTDPEPPQPQWDSGTWRELRDDFDWRFKAVGFGVIQQPEDSSLNPGNLLQVPHYETELDLRPDFSLKFRQVELSVKPRLELKWMGWEDGTVDGKTDTDGDLFINEWLARFMVTEKLFVSYGRENLQWGPSFLISPSNPFTQDNGKNNPERELSGLDYARAIWIPDPSWTVSFIANTNEGRKKFLDGFKRAHALKLDYTGNKKYFSLIPCFNESGNFALGSLGGWSASDAWLIYAEGSIKDSQGTSILVGQSYTLEIGPTLTFEYYHNARGCTESSIQDCFPRFGGHSNRDDLLFRDNYIMLQFMNTRIKNLLNVILRWIWDMDDGSSRSVAIVEYELGNHVKLFTTGDCFFGNKESEFGSLMNYSLMIGAEYNF
jgi:hypothetical protein